jgi:hypothetical protein
MPESGQTSVEWLVAVTGVVALATTLAVAVPSVAPALTGGMQTKICRVTGGSCDGPSAAPAPSAPRAQTAPAASRPPATPLSSTTCATMGSPSSGGVSSGMTRASCRAAAHLYYKAVVVGGGFSYCHHAVCREE